MLDVATDHGHRFLGENEQRFCNVVGEGLFGEQLQKQ